MSRWTLPLPAGFAPPPQQETTARCLTLLQHPRTPEDVGRFRKSYFREPGTCHELESNQKRIEPMFGIVTSGSEHVPETLNNRLNTEYQRMKLAKLEANYASHKREPLGKSYSRHYNLPAHTQGPDFAFGVSATVSESAKELLYPSTSGGLLKNKEGEALYKRSHGSVAPGEHLNRNYRWKEAKIDPAKHRFGATPIGSTSGEVAEIFNPGMDESKISPTIAPKHLEDRRSLYDRVGKPRHLGVASTDKVNGNHVFGISTHDSDSAWLCIQGEYLPEEQRSDLDLGCAVRHGWKNATADTRLFGIPTIRSDIPAPLRRSIADGRNYGDDVSAQALLYPQESAFGSMTKAEFVEPRSEKYLRKLFENIGHQVPDENFERIIKQATQSVRYTPVGQVGIADYRDALNDFLEEQERGSVALH